MDTFGKEERDIQDEFAKWVAVSFFFFFFFKSSPWGGGTERKGEEEEGWADK